MDELAVIIGYFNSTILISGGRSRWGEGLQKHKSA